MPSRQLPSAAAPARPTPPSRRIGFGPASKRCPACAVCFLAQLDRVTASRYTLTCVRDLAVIEPALTRSEAAKACIRSPDYEDLCAECREIRAGRTCPSWPDDAPAKAARVAAPRGGAGLSARSMR